ncbi:type II toxin-antitoxin system HicA family toxin [Sphingobium algorifonticola]|uniref:Type II toxin-antitoxin system HicA family toxin n=1 Tax=Sphingobium algorifonticola TaxID=2008318 RepID=A0A437JBT4_9SPHN|nr:type II toxin-antitoxin system HicA family toxin [Sphingobium algorifonticola]RVT43233.1 type II toxin-antitoxin system HicA family toxin [Sphingobium algorifonticola]
MVKPAKLFQRLLQGSRNLSFRDFQHLLEAFGFRLVRVSGSHHVYAQHGLDRPLIIQPNGKDAKTYQIEQFLDMVEAYGLSMDE